MSQNLDGAPDYDPIRRVSYPQTEIFLLLYSVTDFASFNAIKSKWLPEIRELGPAPDIPFIVVSTKIDVRNSGEAPIEDVVTPNGGFVTLEQGSTLAVELGAAAFHEFSSKSGEGFSELFNIIVQVYTRTRTAQVRSRCSLM